MGQCRGNAGNLMQHWVLAETVMELQRHVGMDDRLLLVTSHSMAPWSVPSELTKPSSGDTRPQFDRARLRLSAPASPYEKAWAALSLYRAGLPYPSSAMLTRELWTGPLSVTLCEADGGVADEIAGWLSLPETRAQFQGELCRGDWRFRLQDGIRTADAGALFIEMDPMRFEHHPPPNGRDDRAVLFPEDLALLVHAVAGVEEPVVVQISSFSANNNNPHRLTEPVIVDVLAQGGFVQMGRAEANGNMMSVVFGRGVELWTEDTQSLEQRFSEWWQGRLAAA